VIEIRFHGRGGQGAVVASQMLACAAFEGGRYVQAFPSFGVERRGAPVTAFTRIDDRPIRVRCQIYEPDHVIVLDATLLESVDVAAGLKDNGWILINSGFPPGHFKFPRYRVATLDANSIAIKYRLGPQTSPIVNTAILGAFIKITGLTSLETLLEAVRKGVPINPRGNVEATKEAYEKVLTAEEKARIQV